MRTSIWLVRHTQTELNKARRYQGTSDSPLTAYGLRQAAALARRLQRIPFTSALVSPHNRTRSVAAMILAGRTVPLSEDACWDELHHGRWEGLSYREVCSRFPVEAAARFADGLHGRALGGESLAEVAQRVLASWQTLLRERSGERVLVVTHATPIQLLLCATSRLPIEHYWHWRIDLGSITALDIYSGTLIVRMVNEVPRL
jgi:2,3-bisphosphoglycerate-dependent phosphoglycerate mutase/probable phosphoglycerate mutase